jgi:hypothetical protein
MSSTSRAAIPAIHETSTSCPRPGVMARRASEQRFHVAALVGTVRCAHFAAAAACKLLTKRAGRHHDDVGTVITNGQPSPDPAVAHVTQTAGLRV